MKILCFTVLLYVIRSKEVLIKLVVVEKGAEVDRKPFNVHYVVSSTFCRFLFFYLVEAILESVNLIK